MPHRGHSLPDALKPIRINMTHPSPSQCARILELLQRRAGQPVPMPELGEASKSRNVHSRISNLRKLGEKQGFTIKQHSVHEGRNIHSFYTLENL